MSERRRIKPWNSLFQVSKQWWTVLDTEVKILVSKNAVNVLTNCGTVSFSRRTVLHGFREKNSMSSVPKEAVRKIAVLDHVLGVRNSNLDLDPGSSQFIQEISCVVPRITAQLVTSISFPIHCSFSFHVSCIFQATYGVVK